MVCDECYREEDDVYSCVCCGSRIYGSDAYWIGDDPVCDNCYDKECFVCNDCGESFFNCDKHYNRETQEYLCVWCNKKRQEEE